MNKRLFTSEAVSEGHPDKVADQISDAILDSFLAQDKESRVAVETMVTTGQVIVAGEVTSEAYVDVQKVVRDTIRRIGYTRPELGFDADSCGVLTAIHEQSTDISRGVTATDGREQGAGDQGIMFGYACSETYTFMPATHYLANLILMTLADIRRDSGFGMPYLRPDSKSQVTMELDEAGNPLRIDTIVLSTQHDEFASDKAMQEKIGYDVVNILMPLVKSRIRDERVLRLFNDEIRYYVNPTGKFVIGGPAGDTGLTGRKIICDTYGGYGAHGGGAFSGKDPSKVDRSAAYAARYIAKNLVANAIADRVLIQLAYAIGVAEPVSINVNTYGTAHNTTDERIEDFIRRHFDLTPAGIERMLYLKAPIYERTAAYGHFGRNPFAAERSDKFEELLFFPWERVMGNDELYRL
jgi:S-adenosylmethionine synthetase